MYIQLSSTSQSKITEILEHLSIQYDLEELTPEDLIDALLDIGVDLVVNDEDAMPRAKERLVSYCGNKIRPQIL